MKPYIQNRKDLVAYQKDIIVKLKKLAQSTNNNRARIKIHKSERDKTNEMIIALKKNSYIRPHIHPNSKTESYHIIKGKMNVYVFSKKGKKIKVIKMGHLGTNLNFFYRANKSYYHLPMAVTEWCIYHEVYSGPFKKVKDVKYAKWSPLEFEKKSVNKFLSKIGHR